MNSTSYALRGKSIHKRGLSDPKDQLEANFQTLRSYYEKALNENRALKSESMRNESTLSSIQYDGNIISKLSLANEVEELHEALSKTHESINLIYTHYLSLENINDEIRREIDEFGSNGASNKDTEVKSVSII